MSVNSTGGKVRNILVKRQKRFFSNKLTQFSVQGEGNFIMYRNNIYSAQRGMLDSNEYKVQKLPAGTRKGFPLFADIEVWGEEGDGERRKT